MALTNVLLQHGVVKRHHEIRALDTCLSGRCPQPHWKSHHKKPWWPFVSWISLICLRNMNNNKPFVTCMSRKHGQKLAICLLHVPYMSQKHGQKFAICLLHVPYIPQKHGQKLAFCAACPLYVSQTWTKIGFCLLHVPYMSHKHGQWTRHLSAAFPLCNTAICLRNIDVRVRFYV